MDNRTQKQGKGDVPNFYNFDGGPYLTEDRGGTISGVPARARVERGAVQRSLRPAGGVSRRSGRMIEVASRLEDRLQAFTPTGGTVHLDFSRSYRRLYFRFRVPASLSLALRVGGDDDARGGVRGGKGDVPNFYNFGNRGRTQFFQFTRPSAHQHRSIPRGSVPRVPARARVERGAGRQSRWPAGGVSRRSGRMIEVASRL